MPDRTEYIDAVREQAFTVDDGSRIVHCFVGAFIGADWDVEDVVREIEKAADVKWIGHLLGHDLAVLTAEGNVRCFQVTRDGGE
jgi:hypothetical protein